MLTSEARSSHGVAQLLFDVTFNNFSAIVMMVSGCDRELNACFYSAASLKYHARDTYTIPHLVTS